MYTTSSGRFHAEWWLKRCRVFHSLLKKSPTFVYWDLIMRYEPLFLIFIKAHREEFPFVCWSIGRTHSTVLCIGPYKLRSMGASPYQRYEVLAQLCQGWVREMLSLGAFKNNEQFLAIPFDQAHEQENKIRGCYGAYWETCCLPMMDALRARDGAAS